jgi:hypothetical protein
VTEITIPGGNDKGKTVAEASDKTLQYWAVEGRNEAVRNACAAELAKRGIQPPERNTQTEERRDPAPSGGRTQQAIARQEGTLVEGNFANAKDATAALQRASEDYHLVSPATVCGNLPEGCEVTLSMVHIDPNDPNLYKVGGKIGLDRVSLAKIAQAAGVTVTQSRRTDNGGHPHYCSWMVEIAYRLFDGSLVRRQGSVEIDCREPDGAAYVEIVEKARNAKDGPRKPDAQLLELRKFLTRHAESKALNRAIASMGIRRSYTADELRKPFVVARVMFTGRSNDPEARREFRSHIATSFLSGTSALYGGQAQTRQLPPVPTEGYSSGEFDTGEVL